VGRCGGAAGELSWPKVALQNRRIRDKGESKHGNDAYEASRSSVGHILRLLFGMKHLTTEWQVGDGTGSARLADYVVARAPNAAMPRMPSGPSNEIAYNKELLDQRRGREGPDPSDAGAAVARAKPGARAPSSERYCGYSALRMAVAGPDGEGSVTHRVQSLRTPPSHGGFTSDGGMKVGVEWDG
jgi:hypothetical protein